MNSGWMGKIIRVNLTSGAVKIEPLNLKDAKLFVGGRGLGTKLYVDEVNPAAGPFSVENNLIFMTGPLTGTLAACSGMYEAVTKMPSSGTLGACSFGGHFGPELKFAGYDGIIFEGKAKTPVYLLIHDDRVELRHASHLWSGNASETIRELEKDTDENAKIVCLGSSVEELVLFSGSVSHRTGTTVSSEIGAVMGEKKLKAIVAIGTKSIGVAKNKEFLDVCLKTRELIKENPVTGVGPSAPKTQVPASTLKKSCFGCTLGCGRIVELKNSRHEGSEYEADWSLGPECGNNVPVMGNSLAVTDEAAKQKALRELTAVVDSLGICRITLAAMGLPEITGLFQACTGVEYTEKEILQIGEKICDLEKAFDQKKA